jgi:hypothetical protein
LRLTPALLALATLLGTSAAGKAESVWRVTGATVTLSIAESRLAEHGIGVVGARSTGGYTFTAAPGLDVSVETRDGRLLAPGGGILSIPVRGGLALRAKVPVFLDDFAVELDPLRLVSADPDLAVPLTVRNGSVLLDPARDLLSVPRADLFISEAWARRLGRPDLAGEWVGELEVELEARYVLTTGGAPERGAARGDNRGGVLDILLGELYGIGRTGRVGVYPSGKVGLAAATTSCNNGTVVVPWNAPMAETHPFIGLALYREMNGTLEMLGQNWIKHGFAALQNDQCGLGCVGGSPFTELGVGCSDTYAIGANASPYYLGPRSEVNPHTGEWEACGSWFDALPVDCERDFLGDAPDPVVRRIEVHDADLDLPGATYYYEGIYIVADDDSVHNNVGWRKCTMTWDPHGFWDFQTVGAQLTPEPGPVVAAWADDLDSVSVAPDDGLAFLGVKVTPAGPDWHYEYALYNRTSARGIRSFAVPIGSANLSNIEFRDVDEDAGNDWTASVSNNWITWSTDDWATDPQAPALRYQTLFNFRFDADAGPVTAMTRMDLFEPGIGTAFFLNGPAPSAVLTGAPELAAAGLTLRVEPNPFSRTGHVAFSATRTGPARLTVLDVAGRTVRVLVDGDVPAGHHEVDWNGRDTGGARLSSGVYFFRLEQGGETRTRKGLLLR